MEGARGQQHVRPSPTPNLQMEVMRFGLAVTVSLNWSRSPKPFNQPGQVWRRHSIRRGDAGDFRGSVGSKDRGASAAEQSTKYSVWCLLGSGKLWYTSKTKDLQQAEQVRLFQQADANRDGKIQVQEFITWLLGKITCDCSGSLACLQGFS